MDDYELRVEDLMNLKDLVRLLLRIAADCLMMRSSHKIGFPLLEVNYSRSSIYVLFARLYIQLSEYPEEGGPLQDDVGSLTCR